MRSRGLRSSWSGSFRVGQLPVGTRMLFCDRRCWRMPSVGARWFRFAGHPGWQELADLGASVGFGVNFSPLLGAFRGVRGEYPPAGKVMKFAGGLLSSTSEKVKRPFLSESPSACGIGSGGWVEICWNRVPLKEGVGVSPRGWGRDFHRVKCLYYVYMFIT